MHENVQILSPPPYGILEEYIPLDLRIIGDMNWKIMENSIPVSTCGCAHKIMEREMLWFEVYTLLSVFRAFGLT